MTPLRDMSRQVKLRSLVGVLAIGASLSGGSFACGRVADEVGADGGGPDGSTVDSTVDLVVADAVADTRSSHLEAGDASGPDASQDSAADIIIPDAVLDAPTSADAGDASAIATDAPSDSAWDVGMEDSAVDSPSCPEARDAGPEPPSCAPGGPGMTNCGAGGSGTESCCTSLEVCGGTFYRDYADGVDSLPATVSSFRLDRYEITLGRFRQFVAAVVGGWLPRDGSGKHTYLNGGSGLYAGTVADAGIYESGWDASDWNSLLPTTLTAWTNSFSLEGYDWTSSAGGHESNPIGGVSWYEAYAFCIWDGGFLPSLTEWEYAAAGGGGTNGQRVYPWSSPPASTTIDCSHANYGGSSWPTTACVAGGFNNVGSESPRGDGAFGQADLAGNAREWSLDYDSLRFTSCVDCASVRLPYGGSARMWQSGSYWLGASYELASFSTPYYALGLDSDQGARCARAP